MHIHAKYGCPVHGQVFLQCSIARLEKLADTDALTSLCNRRVMNEKADIFFDKAFSSQTSFSVEMLDIDNFKQINDTYGHQTGDQVLICLAEAMNTLTDENTIAARYGGDEFILIRKGKSDEELLADAEKLNALIKEKTEASSLPSFTISQGIFSRIPDYRSRVWDFTSGADRALYACKNKGKNQTLLIHHPKDLAD